MPIDVKQSLNLVSMRDGSSDPDERYCFGVASHYIYTFSAPHCVGGESDHLHIRPTPLYQGFGNGWRFEDNNVEGIQTRKNRL